MQTDSDTNKLIRTKLAYIDQDCESEVRKAVNDLYSNIKYENGRLRVPDFQSAANLMVSVISCKEKRFNAEISRILSTFGGFQGSDELEYAKKQVASYFEEARYLNRFEGFLGCVERAAASYGLKFDRQAYRTDIATSLFEVGVKNSAQRALASVHTELAIHLRNDRVETPIMSSPQIDHVKACLDKMKSHRLIAVLVVAFIIITGLGSLTDAIDKLITHSSKHIVPLLSEKELYFELDKDRVTYAGGDGSSTENAVVIVGADSTDAGVGAEHFWISKKYPDYRSFMQTHYTETPRKAIVKVFDSDGTEQGDFEAEVPKEQLRQYDVISIQMDEKVRDVHFDITDFYGKPVLDPLVRSVVEGMQQHYETTKSN